MTCQIQSHEDTKNYKLNSCNKALIHAKGQVSDEGSVHKLRIPSPPSVTPKRHLAYYFYHARPNTSDCVKLFMIDT